MRTALRWLGGLFIVYLLLKAAWRLTAAVGQRDWAEAVVSVLGLLFVLWIFDTFRPRGRTWASQLCSSRPSR
ncbi:hypothetical protein C3E78_07885 [Aeromicrobium chenweiae]|uniref:Uncharacterized protein n=1 Tax=Aeromicrobium chenweiae TaxID=2079793 RepID=A0A2S0WL99_9ACTN|nr:hypothetical protein C3E78_07885 [Aeromicrobium chenweiae]